MFTQFLNTMRYGVLIVASALVFVGVPGKAWGRESNPKDFESIADILLQNEFFCSFPQSDQQEFLEVVRECEGSELVQVEFGRMSLNRSSRLAQILDNWAKFSTEVQLPLELRKGQLKMHLAIHLFAPVRAASDENASKVQAQLHEIQEWVDSADISQEAREYVLPHVTGALRGTADDMTPLFKYPLSGGSFERLKVEFVRSLGMYAIVSKAGEGATNQAAFPLPGKLGDLIVQSYADAIPESVRTEAQKLFNTIEEFADARGLSETVIKAVQTQQMREMENFHEEFYGDFNRRVEMIQLEEQGTVLDGDFVIAQRESLSVIQIVCMIVGLVLVLISFIRIVFRMMTKK